MGRKYHNESESCWRWGKEEGVVEQQRRLIPDAGEWGPGMGKGKGMESWRLLIEAAILFVYIKNATTEV